MRRRDARPADVEHDTIVDRTVTTEISVAGANCPWCLNDTLAELRREPGVVAAVASSTGQCVRVEHRGVAVGRLVAVMRERLHADATSSTEHVMVAVDPLVADLRCTHHTLRRDLTPDV